MPRKKSFADEVVAEVATFPRPSIRPFTSVVQQLMKAAGNAGIPVKRHLKHQVKIGANGEYTAQYQHAHSNPRRRNELIIRKGQKIVFYAQADDVASPKFQAFCANPRSVLTDL